MMRMRMKSKSIERTLDMDILASEAYQSTAKLVEREILQDSLERPD